MIVIGMIGGWRSSVGAPRKRLRRPTKNCAARSQAGFASLVVRRKYSTGVLKASLNPINRRQSFMPCGARVATPRTPSASLGCAKPVEQ
jgi:hypothetical protein